MTAPKYLIIEAETLEARKYHRMLVEEALQNAKLSPDQRAELAAELNEALMLECSAQNAEDAVEEEEKAKKSGGDGEGGDEGSASGQGSAGGSGSGGGMTGDEGEEGKVEDVSEVELFELLFFLADAELRQPAADDTPLAATTLLYDPNEKTAHIHEPYTTDFEDSHHSPMDLLPSLENHAVTLGAKELCVRVHPDAVSLFVKKLGYQPVGKIVARRGVAVQKMRKSLANHQFLKNDVL